MRADWLIAVSHSNIGDTFIEYYRFIQPPCREGLNIVVFSLALSVQFSKQFSSLLTCDFSQQIQTHFVIIVWLLNKLEGDGLNCWGLARKDRCVGLFSFNLPVSPVYIWVNHSMNQKDREKYVVGIVAHIYPLLLCLMLIRRKRIGFRGDSTFNLLGLFVAMSTWALVCEKQWTTLIINYTTS